MGELSKIEWTHHTFNPWRGCARVSEGCRHCYAEAMSKRNPSVLGTWGVDGTRVVASSDYWRQPLRWAERARKVGERQRVFCASLADVGEDRPDLVEPRERLCGVIRATAQHLDWLLLTKRPENMARLFPEEILRRCWVGTTAENQTMADERIPRLLQTPAAIRFVSAEPLLGQVDLLRWMQHQAVYRIHAPSPSGKQQSQCVECGRVTAGMERVCRMIEMGEGLSWVIVGGESGHGARPMRIAWARKIVAQCRAAGVPVFMKQLGARPEGDPRPPERHDLETGARILTVMQAIEIRDRKGGDPSEWPEDLRVRQIPTPEAWKIKRGR